MGDPVKAEPEARTLADNLYTACLAKPDVSTWRPNDLVALGFASDVAGLMPACIG